MMPHLIKKLLLLCLIMKTATTFANGFEIDPASLTFNGYRCGSTFRPHQQILMQYTAKDYFFSGNERNKYGYYIFEFQRAGVLWKCSQERQPGRSDRIFTPKHL